MLAVAAAAFFSFMKTLLRVCWVLFFFGKQKDEWSEEPVSDHRTHTHTHIYWLIFDARCLPEEKNQIQTNLFWCVHWFYVLFSRSNRILCVSSPFRLFEFENFSCKFRLILDEGAWLTIETSLIPWLRWRTHLLELSFSWPSVTNLMIYTIMPS